MYVRQSMPWTTGKQPLTRGGNLLVQNACLDHFRDGLSDGRTPQPINQSINQSISQSAISNQSIRHRAIQQRTVIPPWWMLLPNWPLLNQSINQSISNQQSVISQSSAISEQGSSPLAGLHRRLVVCSAARRPSNTLLDKPCFLTPFRSLHRIRVLRCL